MKEFDYIIAGAGAAGMQIAYRMSKDSFFDTKRILVIDQEQKNNNDRTWCFWERGKGEWDSILEKSWDNAEFKGEGFSRNFPLGEFKYKMIRSKAFYDFVATRLLQKANVERVIARVDAYASDSEGVTVKCDSSSYRTKYLISSIADLSDAQNSKVHPYLRQHFVGWFIKTKQDCFDPTTAVMMDFDIHQKGNTRFIYVLPISGNYALVEYTLFSDKLLAREEYEEGIKSYLNEKGILDFEIVEKELGEIPMTTFPLERRNENRVLFVGTAGGWTRASTGYTFYNASKKSLELCEFLKTEKPFLRFEKKSRFHFYDFVMLDVLLRRNELGREFFTSVYANNPIEVVFDFLNGESSFKNELKLMMRAKPRWRFFLSAMRFLWFRIIS